MAQAARIDEERADGPAAADDRALTSRSVPFGSRTARVGQEERTASAEDTPEQRRTADALATLAVDLVLQGRNHEALRACGELIGRDDHDLQALDTALWVANTAQASALAADIAALGAELRPHDGGRQRTAAALLAQVLRHGEALPYAAAASELMPGDFDAALLLGVLQNQTGQAADAIPSLLRALTLRPAYPETYHQLSVASARLGGDEVARELAAKAFRLDPANASRAIFAATLLRQAGRLSDAIALLSACESGGEGAAHAARALSDFLMSDGRLDDALEQIDKALALRPNHPEYLLFRAGLLNQTGAFQPAALLIDAALDIDPDNLNARRHAVSLYLESGCFERAVQSTAELLRRVPANDEYASCMLHVLATRSEAAVEVPKLADLKRRGPPRRPRPAPTIPERLQTQVRVIGALMLREMRTRFGESRLGYVWVLVEMAIHLGVLAIVFQFMMHGQPPMGRSFFFFYFTGLWPYLLFLHTSEHAGSGIQQNRHMLQLPMVNHFNVILSRGLLELFTQTVIGGLFIAGFLFAGVHALPNDLGQAALALLVAWSFGLGCGFINAVMNTLMQAWHHLFSVFIRVLYFCSGIFYVPAAMPVPIRNVLAWNPLLHCVDWFRTTFFDSYQPHWLDRPYAIVATLIVMVVGLALEALFRRRLRKPA